MTLVDEDKVVRKPAAASSETLKKYLQEISRLPRITPEEEKVLGDRIQRNPNDKQALDRQTYFYPHADREGARVKGHALAAEPGISTIFRKLYYNPDGHGRHNEWDFVTYFECADEHLATFDQICRSLRDVRQNPEWRYVTEGPEWRGKRVQRW